MKSFKLYSINLKASESTFDIMAGMKEGKRSVEEPSTDRTDIQMSKASFLVS